MNHLSNSQLRDFMMGRPAAAELLELDDHLACCPDCRVALERLSQAGQRIAGLETQFTIPGAHLRFALLRELVHGAIPTEDQARHLAHCESCAAELEDLKQFAGSLDATPRSGIAILQFPQVRRRRAWFNPAGMGLAAAFILAAAVFFYWHAGTPASTDQGAIATLRDGDRLLSLDSAGTLHGASGLDAEQTAAIAHVLQTGKIDVALAPELTLSRSETLLGARDAGPAFKIVAPVNCVSISDEPIFRWEPLAGATQYRVDVYIAGYRRVIESPLMKGTSWKPSIPLPRGAVYTWTVTASTAQGQVRIPAPPAPEATFQVLSADAAIELSKAARNHGNDPLLLAILYAQAGAIDEARQQFVMLEQTNPGNPTAVRIKASLDQFAPSPIKTNGAQ